MAEFIAFDGAVEVMGAAIMAVSAGLGRRAIPILERYKLNDLQREHWYPQQAWLNAFRDISQNGFADLVMIGMKIPDEAVWPPVVKTVHDALASINSAYQMNHRGGEIGGYFYKQVSEQQGLMFCENPYPSDFDYGIIYRTAKKFAPPKSHISVYLDKEKLSRKQGADACTYHILWTQF